MHCIWNQPQIKAWADRFAEKQHALFLGPWPALPHRARRCVEIQRKFPTSPEATPPGRWKHSPLCALVDSRMPVVVIALNDTLLEQVKSNIQRSKRAAELFVFTDLDSRRNFDRACIIRGPRHAGLLADQCTPSPVQLLAYRAGSGQRHRQWTNRQPRSRA